MSTAWPLCPSGAGWREIQIVTVWSPRLLWGWILQYRGLCCWGGGTKTKSFSSAHWSAPLLKEMERASWKKKRKKKLTVLALSGISSGERSNPCMIKPRFLQCRLGFLVATRADSLPCGWNNGASCLCGSMTKEQEPRTSALWSTVVYKRYGGRGGGGLSFESRRD